MTGSAEHSDLRDAWLVAHLDGALDEPQTIELRLALAASPELAQRLALLERGSRDFKRAFEPLLEVAPDDKMQEMLSGLIGQSQLDNVVPLRPAPKSMWQGFAGMAAAAGIAVAVFSGGVYTGWQTGETPVVQKTSIGWRQAAAQYISLYSKQTLAGYPTNPALQSEGLQRISTALEFDLTRDKTTIDNLAFKGSQILQLNGKPLVQIAYLHKGETPVALCIIKSGKSPYAQKNRTAPWPQYRPLDRRGTRLYVDWQSSAKRAAKAGRATGGSVLLIRFFLAVHPGKRFPLRGSL